MSKLPAPGANFEEEEEQHEDEAGANVEDDTQTHVDTVEAQTQDPHPPSSPTSPLPVAWHLAPVLTRLLPLGPACGSRILLFPVSVSALILWLSGPNRIGIGVCGRSRGSWGGEGVFGGQVRGAVVTSKEAEDVVLVPDMDAVFLLVTGSAEGGARPRSFREKGVVTQRACGGGLRLDVGAT